MHIPTRFTIAIHTLLCIACFAPHRKVTSTFLADSTNANAVIVRRILGQLKEAGLVQVAAGVGGATVAKPLCDITLLDIFHAVEAVDTDFFGFLNFLCC